MIEVLLAFITCSAVTHECAPVEITRRYRRWGEGYCESLAKPAAWNYISSYARPELGLVIEGEVVCVVIGEPA